MVPVEVGSKLRLELGVDRDGAGGITGLAPTVALRRPDVAGSYLDFADRTFKTSGWTTRLAILTAVSASLAPGQYEYTLDLALVAAAVAGLELIAEYAVSNGADINRTACDEYVVRESAAQLDWVYAVHANRQEDAPGTPGTVSVYRADGVTVWKTAQLRDYTGAGVGATSGLPARRTAFVP